VQTCFKLQVLGAALPLLLLLKYLLEAIISWELGTAAEALTELEWPALSVFQSTAFPPPSQLNASLNASDVLQIAYDTVQAKPFDSMALIADDLAVGDPASEFSRTLCIHIPNS
jgi:hypothetical protein